MSCAACLLKIGRGDMLSCYSCQGNYHYRCVGMTLAYYTENRHLLMSSWLCPSCDIATKRTKNDNTPIRQRHQCQLNDTTMSVDDYAQNDKILTEESLNSNIQNIDSPPMNTNIDTITLDKFSQLLDTKLEEKLERHKQSILTEIKTAFQSEISKAINNVKQELTQSTNALHTEQINIKEDITNINSRIKKLETERNLLQTEIQNIQKYSMNATQTENVADKTLVIYGLNEYYNEHEIDLERRVTDAFMSIMNIDLTGYIEVIQRIGKRGNRRPVRLELISKRMTKYILNNARQFKTTGIYVSEFLDQQSLQKRRSQQETKKSLGENERSYYDKPQQSTSHVYTQPELQTQNNRQEKPGNSQNIGGTFRF